MRVFCAGHCVRKYIAGHCVWECFAGHCVWVYSAGLCVRESRAVHFVSEYRAGHYLSDFRAWQFVDTVLRLLRLDEMNLFLHFICCLIPCLYAPGHTVGKHRYAIVDDVSIRLQRTSAVLLVAFCNFRNCIATGFFEMGPDCILVPSLKIGGTAALL